MNAARTTSAAFPSALPPTTTVWATLAANPSICAPRSIFTTSPFLSLIESSGQGEKCPATSFTDKQQGKAIPLSSFFDFLLLNVFCNSSSIKVSIYPQMVPTSAPSTQAAIALRRAAKKRK